MLAFDASVCSDVGQATRREWIVANGIGGYASSTLCGINTRRYHGMLVAALAPPVGRTVLVSKLEDEVIAGQTRVSLSSNSYPGEVHPDGHTLLRAVSLCRGIPSFVYSVDGGELTRRVAMVHGENTTLLEYAWAGSAAATLAIRPLITCRDYHWLCRARADITVHHEEHPGGVALRPRPDGPMIYVSGTLGGYIHEPTWYFNFQLAQEAQRGLDAEEDLFCPGVLYTTLEPGEKSYVVLSTEPHEAAEAEALFAAEEARRAELLRAAPGVADDPVLSELTLAADSFIVRRGSGKLSVLAGYHWFSDWGRDTMIALPGLTLSTGRPDVCRQVLMTYAGFVSEGMLPNRFPDSGEEPEYNTVDATLWYFIAVHRYLSATGDSTLAEELAPVLGGIIQAHFEGTRYGIRVDDDGLLWAGDPGTQLTWMDAKVDGFPVTPRFGKPVEIQGLWYNALRIYAGIAGRRRKPLSAKAAREAAERVERAFMPTFYDPGYGFLADVVRGDERDFSLRPNQVITMGLPHRLVPADITRAVLARVADELVTPFGLRSLSPADPSYREGYGGNQWSRDTAYHQGTVWAWLTGSYVDAYLDAYGATAEAIGEMRRQVQPLLDHVRDAGIGTVSEIFDGDSPHEPRGCVSQSWSVAELLRALWALRGQDAPL